MELMALYWGLMIAFYFVASKLRSKKEKLGFIEKLMNITIFILVLIMGVRMGANPEVIANLGTIGIQSVIITVFTVFGSMFFVFLLRKVMKLNRHGITDEQEERERLEALEKGEKEEEPSNGLAFTLIILAFVVAGLLIGYLVVPKIYSDVDYFQEISDTWLVIGICILLSLVGFNLGLDGKIFKNMKLVGPKALLFPLAAILGSIVFGGLYCIISPVSLREALAISTGFGWYTLAPGIIAEAGFAVSGAISFTHNVIRETLGIVIIPLAAKKIGYLEATAIPGVAAMDVCMPIVERSTRPETVVYSFCTGAMMCIAVTVLTPLFIG